VPWTADAFPIAAFESHIDARTGVVAIVSPNNPTGGVATLADVPALAAKAPQALILLDHAYVEYADDDLTLGVLDLPNVVVVRIVQGVGPALPRRLCSGRGVRDWCAAGGGRSLSVAGPSIALALARLRRWRRVVAPPRDAHS
jgi:histidinol-phosphate aminotransferase